MDRQDGTAEPERKEAGSARSGSSLTSSAPVRSLAARTLQGAGWLMVWRFASRGLGIVNTVVLVRLLTPGDFGLVALGMSFALSIDSLSYLGVQEALVREHAPGRVLYDTAFTINALRGLITGLIIAACAQPAARLFGDARLVPIFWVLAITLFMSCLENIGTVDFQRDVTFGKQLPIVLGPRIAGIVASIAVAVIWRSYWALVAGILVSRGARLIATYIVHPYRPRVTLRAWEGLIGFSFWSWALSMTALVQSRAGTFIIGAYLNPIAVGIYTIGGEIGGLASSELLDPISQALFAGFSSARRSGDSVASAYLRSISVVALVTLPANAGIALVAAPMMHLAFGPRWDAAIPLVQLFACVGVCRVAGSISSALLMAEGLPRVGFWIELTMTALRVSCLLALAPWLGLIGVAAGMAATGVIEEAIYLLVTFRLMRLRGLDLLRNVWRPTLAAAVMAAVLQYGGLTRIRPDQGMWDQAAALAIAVTVGAGTFMAMLAAAWWTSGRPQGAETYLLATINNAARRRATT